MFFCLRYGLVWVDGLNNFAGSQIWGKGASTIELIDEFLEFHPIGETDYYRFFNPACFVRVVFSESR